MDLVKTKVFFRCMEPLMKAQISRVLGDKKESQENISYCGHYKYYICLKEKYINDI